MGRIEKTVFISYRRTNVPWALAIYQDLTMHGYDVFFDYQSIDSGNFEKVILENIRTHAHFLVILTPSALERCKEPGDWLRREIETAMDEERNIVPLMLESFDFGSPLVKEALTGKLAAINTYNGLRVYSEYFFEAMDKLRERYMNVEVRETAALLLNAEATKVTETQKTAASDAAPVEKEQLTAQEWFERGYVFQEAKNWDEAFRCYSEAIRLDPNLDTAYNNLGVLLRNLKRYEEAETAYRKAIQLNPSLSGVYSNLGLLLHENLKRYGEAEAVYRKAITLNPSLPEAYSNLGNLLGDLKRYEEAEAAYRKAIELNPSDNTTYFNLGNLLENLKRYEEAETAYRKAIELNPSLPQAYSNLGLLLHEKLKRYKEAETAYRKAIELDPYLPQVYSNFGNILRTMKRYEEAETAYRKAIELDPSYAKAYSNFGVLLNDLKRYREAEAVYLTAIDLNPSYDKAYYNLGILLQNLKRYKEAEAAYRQAIQLNPSLPEAYNNLVILLRLISQAEDALPLLEKLIEINPEDFNPYLAIASVNKQMGKGLSKFHTDKAHQHMPNDDWYNRACLESLCDNFDLAFEHLEKAAKRESFNPAWAWDDPDLQWIRSDPRFTKIVGPKPA